MREKLQEIHEILRKFSKTSFLQKMFPFLTAFFLLYLAGLIVFGKIMVIKAGIGIVPVIVVALVTTVFVNTAAFGLLFVLYIRPCVSLSEIMKKNKLQMEQDNLTYDEALEAIFSLLDGSMEREYEAKLLQKQAEFEAMRSQINPHFLYNTLDTIRGYALMENAPVTSQMIEMLSRLFRYMIGQKNELISIGSEIDIIQDYIKIQEYRQNQHIVLVQKIDSDLREKNILSYKIPKLSLEPLVENSIKHGMTGRNREFIITIHISSTKNRLLLNVSDNGCGMTADELAKLNIKLQSNETQVIGSSEKGKKGTGIALTNVNSRIKLFYGDEYGLSVQSDINYGTDIQIMLPLKDEYYEK